MESNFDRSQYCAQKNVGTEHMIVTFAVMGDKSQQWSVVVVALLPMATEIEGGQLKSLRVT